MYSKKTESSIEQTKKKPKQKVKINSKLKKSIIKFQALFRGFLERKRIKEMILKKQLKEIQSCKQSLDHIENYKLPNGAIYTGNIRIN